jgi:predicted HAD superfamily Cof-like phosphohydrolase
LFAVEECADFIRRTAEGALPNIAQAPETTQTAVKKTAQQLWRALHYQQPPKGHAKAISQSLR